MRVVFLLLPLPVHCLFRLVLTRFIFLYSLFSRTFPFSTFGWLMLLLLSSSSSSSLLFNALQTSTRKLQLQRQQHHHNSNEMHKCVDTSTQPNHQPRIEDVRCFLLYTHVVVVVQRTYYSVCKFLVSKIVPHITHKIYIQYTFCSLTCSCLWRFYSLSTRRRRLRRRVRLHFPRFLVFLLVLYILIFLIPIFF